MGEVHKDIPKDLVDKYTDVFNRFVAKNNHTKIFLEKSNEGKNKSQHSSNLSFIDYMGNIAPSPHLEIVNTDDRICDDSLENFISLLKKIIKIERSMFKVYKKRKSHFTSITSFFNEDSDFMKRIESVSNSYDKIYTFSDLIQMLSSSVAILDALYDKYSKDNVNLGYYIENCGQKIKIALDVTLKLLELYYLMELNKQKESKEIEMTPLGQVCIEMIMYEKSFYASDEFFYINNFYITYFLNATLICKIWEEIHSDDTEKTLIVVTGDSHTESLASLLKLICTTVVSINADPKGNIISPKIIDEFLKDDFRHESKRNYSCSIL